MLVPRPDASGTGGFGASGTGGVGGSGATFGRTFQQKVTRDVDILFLIDDSSSMGLAQQKLLADFPTFVSTLQGQVGGPPNVHIAVISSDMGAGDGSIASCDAVGGKKGIFQYTARGACTTTSLSAGATFISDVGGVKNYTGALADVFKCIAALGETGCGFEHQLAALVRALGADGRAAPAENQAFLRPDANLAIVILTNEDDCSASPGVPLFDTGSNTNIASQLGPPANFRCNEFGHLCGAMHPSRAAPNNDVAQMVTYNDCTSNDAEGYLLGVTDTANRLKALKTDPTQVFVASIQGQPTPYTVTWRAPSTTDRSCGAASCPWPAIAHSCTASDTSFADPGVRTAEFVQQFGNHGLQFAICQDSFAPTLERIGEAIGQLLAPACITGQILDDPAKAGLQAKCTVTARVPQSNGTVMDRVLPSCVDSGGAGPCWTATREVASCNGNIAVVITPDPAAPNGIQWATINCGLCTPGETNPASCL